MTQTVVKCLLNLTLLYSALMLLNIRRERYREAQWEREGRRGKERRDGERKEGATMIKLYQKQYPPMIIPILYCLIVFVSLINMFVSEPRSLPCSSFI